MAYEEKNFESLLGLNGFSDQLLKNHFTLYQGYVKNTNKLMENMKALVDSDKMGTPEFAEMKRRFGWEFNGMRLHELYFQNMTKNKSMPSKKVSQLLADSFGTFDNWKADFLATGAMRGIGWAVLYYDPEAKRFFNVWINEHDVGHLSGCKPLLVMDVFEHAFMIDYGLKRADYIDAFMKAIDWNVVEKRL